MYNPDVKNFEIEIPFEQLITGKEETYKFGEEEPVAIRRILPNKSSDSQAYSLINEHPRTINALSGHSTPKDSDEELHQGEDAGTENMSPALQLAVIGDRGVPKEFKGKVLGWVELLQEDPKSWRELGFFDFPDDTLVLSRVYSKRMNWNEDLNNNSVVGELPTLRSSQNRKDLWFAKHAEQDIDYDAPELKGIMESGTNQAMKLVLEMEKKFNEVVSTVDGEQYPKQPRKIVFIATVKQDNKGPIHILENQGFTKHEKSKKEDGENFDVWYKEIN